MENDFSFSILNMNLQDGKKWNPNIDVIEILPYFNFDVYVFEVYENQLKQISRGGIKDFGEFDTIYELPDIPFPFVHKMDIFNPNEIVTIPFVEFISKSLNDELKRQYLNQVLLGTSGIYDNNDDLDDDIGSFLVSNKIAIDFKKGYKKNLKNYLQFIEEIIVEVLERIEIQNDLTILEFISLPLLFDRTISLAKLIELYVFYSINTIEVERYCIEKLNELPVGNKVENKNEKIKWKGTPGEFGAIFNELIDNGFIALIRDKKKVVRLLHSVFEIRSEDGKPISENYLYRCFKDKIKKYPPKKLVIPFSDNYHNDK